MQDLNIAVIGAQGTGKSTFIRRALGLPDTASTANCNRIMTIDGASWIVRFLEMSIDDVHLGERNTIKWPDTVHDSATSRMDAAITIYDVTSQESLAKVPEMMG
jgi:ABC-type phosphate transport system ATPase subunit